MDPQRYLTEIKAKLLATSVVASIAVVEERILSDRGYFRAELNLNLSLNLCSFVFTEFQ